ncbi:DEAD/DEAH box helicase [Heliobacillus mobilis]|uniref:DEAD/DEAH box helicase n=1 Tax=Heliobacterium mobile TaxID=28064 RepID=A0A6I3SLT6_HELMO|nr:DEAD/DEAH box helicase [Heliobacterium mobile]MTV49921.1 DEAD/DEAH box helicase [Heliobacterium mobile]
MVCLKGSVYLARGKGRSWFGFTHDPALDLTVLHPEGVDSLVSLTPNLPIGIALYILQRLRAEAEKKNPADFQPRPSQTGRFWRKLARTLGWGLLEPAEPTVAETGGQEYAYGRPVTEKNDPELSLWSRRTITLLRDLHELPETTTGFPLHVYRPSGGEETLCWLADLKRVAEVLEGRLLFTSELEMALVEKSQLDGIPFPVGQLEDILQVLALAGIVEIYPSVMMTGPEQVRCVRCGQDSRIAASPCVRCGREKCYYCEECLTMGEARLCRPLYGLAGDENWVARWSQNVLPWLMERIPDSGSEPWESEPREIEECNSPMQSVHDAAMAPAPKEGYSPFWPVLTFPLTPAQEAASEQLLHWLDGNFPERREALVWAACGAGKTEVAFAAIAQVLRRGGRVLFAVPRRDVVLELAPRLQCAFPGIPVTTLYGGSRERFGTSPLVAATTHQAIRFYRAFDLVVLDEVDAFPYQGSAMLYHAVARSRKRAGPVILMTATPDAQMKCEVRSKRMQLVSIPARHHGQPLPVPQILLEKEWRWDREQLIFPEKLLTFLHRSVEGDLSQVFLFVPSVFLAHRVGESLKAATRLPPFNDFKGTWVEYSHSRDPDREAKRQRFSRQLFPIFVTTSIMERGITVPRANVVVLFAENERIYDERTLIQMAGRAGRSTERPYGDVWFVATKITAAMQEAVDTIHWLNGQAQKQGFLLSEEKAAQ